MKTIQESSYFILGMGNIGKILVKRLREAGVPSGQILIYDPDEARTKAVTGQYGVKAIGLTDEQGHMADVIIMATPPKAVVEDLQAMSDQLRAGQIVISMAAAVPISQMRKAVNKDIAVLRILPNPPSMVGKGMNPVAFEPGTAQAVKAFAFALLAIMGQTLEVQDELMTWCVGLSGAALRTVLPVLQGMTQAGVEAGLPEGEARRVAAQIMAGTAALALETDLALEEIRSLTPMQTLDEKMVSDLFLDTARNTRQKVEATQAMLMGN